MAKVYSEDAYSLGLLYVYKYSNGIQQMVLLDDLKKFHKCIEDNLSKIYENSNNIYPISYEEEAIYFSSTDEKGNVYYILKPGFDVKRATTMFIGCLPVEYLVATQMDNSLDTLGLVKLNNKIQLKRDVLKCKNKNECCANCDYSISVELQEEILKEHPEYENLKDSELNNVIGHCELEITLEQAKSMGYWCPNYLSREEMCKEQEIILTKKYSYILK